MLLCPVKPVFHHRSFLISGIYEGNPFISGLHYGLKLTVEDVLDEDWAVSFV